MPRTTGSWSRPTPRSCTTRSSSRSQRGADDIKVSDDPGRAVASRPGGDRLPRRWPVATVSVLAVTVVLTVLQFPFPQVRLDLWRAPGALAAGQWWRLVTALLVQYDPVWQIVVVLACLAGVGVLAERIFGHGRWPGWC